MNEQRQAAGRQRLDAIAKLAFGVSPRDPAQPEYRQGHTLGDEHKHWFPAKFFQQYRLFSRFHAKAKAIVFAWVNDEATKQACESADDTGRVFRRMLDSGHPPSDWGALLAEARAESERLARLASGGARRFGFPSAARRC
jgi:toxin YhaV